MLFHSFIPTNYTLFGRAILDVEFLTDDMDGAGTTYKVQKGSVVDKERTKNMKQDRRHRDAALQYAGDFSD